MSAIHDDVAFKQAISALPLSRQRALGARFIRRLADLADDFRLKQALECAERGTPPSDSELLSYYRAARSVEVETYTACGHDTDWLAQAEHFTAAAAAACLQEPENFKGGNPAWKAASLGEGNRRNGLLRFLSRG